MAKISWDKEKVAQYMLENTSCTLDPESEYVSLHKNLTFICGCEDHNKFVRPLSNIIRNVKTGVKVFCKQCHSKHITNIFRYNEDELKDYFLKNFDVKFIRREEEYVILECKCGTIIKKLFRNCQDKKIVPKCEECILKCKEEARQLLAKNKTDQLIANLDFNIKYINYADRAEKSSYILYCRMCGEEIEVRYTTIYGANRNRISRGDVCGNCLHELSRKRWKKDFKQIQDRMEELEYDLITTEKEYINENTDLYFYCKKHMDSGLMSTKWATIRNSGGCEFCKWEKVADAKHVSPEEYKEKFDSCCGDVLELITDYTWANEKITVKHIECGTMFKILPLQATKLSFYCPKCHGSNLECKTSIILSRMNLINYPQYSTDECKHKNKLRFDFVVYKDKSETEIFALIETQGPQHDHPIGFGETDECAILEMFELNKIRDNIKKEYCDANNIKLIELWYYDFENFEDILRKELEGVFL